MLGGLRAFSDDAGRRRIVQSVRYLLCAMQPKCRELTRKLIARSLDWDVVDALWSAVTEGGTYAEPN